MSGDRYGIEFAARISLRPSSPTRSVTRASSRLPLIVPCMSTPGAESITVMTSPLRRIFGRAQGHRGGHWPCRHGHPLRTDLRRGRSRRHRHLSLQELALRRAQRQDRSLRVKEGRGGSYGQARDDLEPHAGYWRSPDASVRHR